MKCLTCNSKGYQESSIAKDANFHPMLIKCPNPQCPYSDKYYQEIRDRFSTLELGPDSVKPSESKVFMREETEGSYELEEGEKIAPSLTMDDITKQFKDNYDSSTKVGHVNPHNTINIDVDSFFLDGDTLSEEGINNILKQIRETITGPTDNKPEITGENEPEANDKASDEADLKSQGAAEIKKALMILEDEVPAEGIDLNIPQEVVNNGALAIVDFVRGHLASKEAQQGSAENHSHWMDDDSVVMSEEYPNLPKAIIDMSEKVMKTNPNAAVILTTPFGPLPTRNFSVADRIMGIIKEYYKHGDELDIADTFDNVIVFPLAKALGFDDEGFDYDGFDGAS